MIQNRKTGKTEHFCTEFVKIIFFAVLLFLAVISMNVTCVVYGGAEVVEYLPDRPLLHLAVLGAAVILAGFLQKRIHGGIRKEQQKRLIWICAGMMAVWILMTFFSPISDQRMVLESAEAFLRGDSSPWEAEGFRYASPLTPRGYAYTYPSQNGLILFFAAVSFVFRGLTPYVLQFLNILFLLTGLFYLSRLFEKNHLLHASMWTVPALAAFFPMTFYITFVYGTIPGFACASATLYYEQCYLEQEKKRDLVVSAVLICLAVLLKSNYLILFTAMLIYLLSNGVFRKKFRFIAAAVFLILMYQISGHAMNHFLEKTTGYPVSDGIPMTAWAEMGMQEGRSGPGWYNGYHVRTFYENNCDTKKTAEAVKEDLKQTLTDFASEPKRAADFFVRKAESIWAEPTFQSLWIQEVKGRSWIFPALTDSLFERDGVLNRVYVGFYNLFQTLIYTGSLVFLLLEWKKIRWNQLLPAVIFIGGFLFHMVWEAKGQYSVCYFILLLPYAYRGILAAVKLWGKRT